ncbi:MAG TPA: TonB-dependent receptor [Rhodothermales bacterium]|nr:TonB-dependent receptor [Rhodothermales bacterium]
MRLFALILAGLLLPSLYAPAARAQSWGTAAGRVTDSASEDPIPGATIIVAGTDFGTASNSDGAYELRLPAGRYQLRFSAIGYESHLDSVSVSRDRTTRLDVSLKPTVVQMEGLTVEEAGAGGQAGAHHLDPGEVQNIPAPFHNGFGALMTLPGVATHNELSNQYSVHGGGFNENLIFLNGFEVFMPFRPRQGEQEGLGLLNPDMARSITLYTGGFPARYGGKLSSALDVRYIRPDGQSLRGSAYVSLLDAGVTASSSAFNGRFGWVAGLRKAQARRFFSTQELKGNYQPDYTDVQGAFSFRLARGHEIEGLGILADHQFLLDPRNRKTYFGTYSLTGPSDLRSLWVSYSNDSAERDGYSTRFGGVRLSDRLSSRLHVEHDLSYFQTSESEFLNLIGSAILYQVDVGEGDANTGAGHMPLGNSRQVDAADNRVDVSTLTGKGRWMFNTGRHAAEAGWSLRSLQFDDRLFEKSAVVGRSLEGDVVRLVVDSLNDTSRLNAVQSSFYAQDAVDLLPERNRLVITGGIRADHFSFNHEWTVSPRLTARYQLNTRTTLLGSWGIYYQAPTYRELRGEPDSTIAGSLNHDIRSQRSIQFVGGGEYFLAKKRLYLHAEAYYKGLSNLISYSVENVQVKYSGHNDSDGYVYGLDFQLRGEFVPGLESWVNYSYMVARERMRPAYTTPENAGLVPRPTDQRHTFSAYIQDYVPGDQTWKIHLRALFGSGLPYTPPEPGRRLGNITEQVPGPRLSERFIEYKRLDMGLTKELLVFKKGISSPVRLELTAEVLNVFDMLNTVAYNWVPNASGIWNRIPTRLTPRTLNVRMLVTF